MRTLQGHLDMEPDSVAAWISLLEHSLSAIPIHSKNASRARSDVALSILLRALSAHPNNTTSKILRIKYLKAGEDIWPSDQLAAEWEKGLKVGGVEIWMEWLEWRFRQTKREFGQIVTDVERALSAFPERKEDHELARLRIFWRLATATRSAGMYPYPTRALRMLISHRILGEGIGYAASSSRTVGVSFVSFHESD